MKRNRMKYGYLIIGMTAAVISMTACKGQQTPASDKSSTAAKTEEASRQTEGQKETETQEKTEPATTAAGTPADTQAAAPVQDPVTEPSGSGSAMIPNPIREVTSSDEFAELGFRLRMPPNTEWYKDPVYQIIDGEIAEIRFYDNITHSDASARAGKETLEDISGVYYKFDESKTEHWTSSLPDGRTIDILVQVVVEESDFQGVLASWNDSGVNYTLWEDDGAKDASSVAKLAVEIASQSAKQ